MIKKTFKNTFALILQRYIIIDNKKYRLPYYIKIPKELLNFIYGMGGFLMVGGSISMFFQSFNIEPNLWIVIPLTIFIALLINFLIVYFSPLVEVQEKINE
ncbi:hypothetical protein CPU12_01190 [Malaciobacter molluscorum LMG 25693]|uniref:Uncharacterized protein n=1 Tax=Malaciobacter molluscorum LMG 25693 TaxID=870501 RepID=A0A2G1DLP2_9BACT|nr:hypothetical protein [Malaciobacter molluscorum]AXX92193.1 hypothetical protein AMOL_1212 [Malaciobacter molluscorum LMG 25693]PHO19422.1 hypothetical protein CPU12_01190 [Malaciobacter molluscorum LMG 25693]